MCAIVARLADCMIMQSKPALIAQYIPPYVPEEICLSYRIGWFLCNA